MLAEIFGNQLDGLHEHNVNVNPPLLPIQNHT